MQLPIYCPLNKSFNFNSTDLINEIEILLINQLQERTLPFLNGRSIYDQENLLHIADASDLNNTSRYTENEQGRRIPVLGKFKTYHVINLTYLPEEPDSYVDIYRSDDPKKLIFWHTYKKPFTWRLELLNTAIKQAVDQFPWDYIQGVRLIYMSPPSIGQIHRDSHPLANQRYYKDGFASITLSIETGGGVLTYLDGKEQKTVNNDVSIFHFNDSVPHGVTSINTNRYQIRIWGKLNVPYCELFL